MIHEGGVLFPFTLNHTGVLLPFFSLLQINQSIHQLHDNT